MKKVYFAIVAVLAWVVFKDFTAEQSAIIIAVAFFFAMAMAIHHFSKEDK